MDTAEVMVVALVVLMALVDLLVDSTEVNLVDILADLGVGRVVLGGHELVPNPNTFYHNNHRSPSVFRTAG